VSMTQRTPRALVFLAAVGLAVLALSGCAPTTTSRTSSPTPSHVSAKHKPAHPNPPALDTSVPASLLNLPCSSLITPTELTGYAGTETAVAVAAIAAGDLAEPEGQLPVVDSIREAGGIDCVWSSGAVNHYDGPDGTVSPYLEISVQFNATSAWAVNAGELGISGSSGGECDDDAVGGECQIDDLVGTGTWIDIYSREATGSDPDAIGDIENTAVAAVKAAGTPSAPTTPQAGTLSIGTQCTDFASNAAVQSALASSTAITSSTPPVTDETFRTWFASLDSLKNHPCVWTQGSTTVAQLAWIPGGAWAWAEDKTQSLADAPLQSLHLTGLKVNDAAWIRCAAADASCIVDLTLGGNWIEATVPASSTAPNKRTAATALAQAIATKLDA
jgi:hypothetical protein